LSIGGGLLLRNAKSSSVKSDRINKSDSIGRSEDVKSAADRPETRQTVSSDKPPADPLKRKATEQLFGQYFRRGYENFHDERYSQAVQDFECATQIAPYLAEGHYYLGWSYAKLLLTRKAEAEYREALRLMGDFRDPQEKLAMLLYERGAYQEAISLLEKMDREKPNDPFVHEELAINYMALGQPETAIPLFEKYNAARGPQAWGYAQLGKAYDQLGDLEKAEELYRQALEIDKHLAIALHWLGLLLARTDRAEDAERFLAEYDRLRKLETTEQQLTMALQQKSIDVERLAQLADTRFQLGKNTAGWKTLDQAERLAPGNDKLAALRKYWTGRAPKTGG
jgi:Flp pilus assembly protein TadD